jgi:pimeloyl-ACP methyl ester carboxylesterase
MTTTAPSREKGTIVRTSSTASLGAMRAAFGVLDRVTPTLSARWALTMWCTLPQNAGRRRDERPRPGDRTRLRHGRGQLVVETWGYGPPVYLVHGWGGWRGQLGAFVEPIVAAGRRVVAFDAPSHGDSSPGAWGPRRSTAVELAAALTAVVDAHGEPAGFVGHSLGAATTALAIADGLPAAPLALVAPVPDVIGASAVLARTLGYGPRTHERFLRKLEARARRPLTDFDLYAMGTRTALPPTMVVHDRADKEVPYEDGRRLAEHWPTAELVTTDGLGHQRILNDPAVIELVAGFVTRT